MATYGCIAAARAWPAARLNADPVCDVQRRWGGICGLRCDI